MVSTKRIAFKKFIFVYLVSLAATSCFTTKESSVSKTENYECSDWNASIQKQISIAMINHILADKDLTKSVNGVSSILEIDDIKNTTGKTIDLESLQNFIFDEVINSGRISISKKAFRLRLLPHEASKAIMPDFTSSSEIKYAEGIYQFIFSFSSTKKSFTKTLSASVSCRN